MVHSGCSNGKKWSVVISEKFSGHDVIIFDSAKIVKSKWGSSRDCSRFGGFVRPQKCVDLLEDWLFDYNYFCYENHAIFVNSKWFSLSGISRGIKKIGMIFNEPLFEKNK